MSSDDKNKPLILDDLTLGQAHLELRTTLKFLHWDRAGSLWTQMTERFPRLALIQVDPNKTTFSLDDKYVFSVGLNNAGTVPHTTILGTAYDPHKSVKDFSELMKTFTDITQERLQINDYSRVGLRLIFYKSYPDKNLASQALLSTKLITVPEGQFFGVQGSPTHPRYSVQWEGGKRGVSIRLRVESFKEEFKPPLEWRDVQPISKEHNRIAYDVDYYTIGTVAVGQFNPVEWVNQVVHLVHRDTNKFLRGA